MFDFFATIFNKIIAFTASIIIATGLVSVPLPPEVPVETPIPVQEVSETQESVIDQELKEEKLEEEKAEKAKIQAQRDAEKETQEEAIKQAQEELRIQKELEEKELKRQTEAKKIAEEEAERQEELKIQPVQKETVEPELILEVEKAETVSLIDTPTPSYRNLHCPKINKIDVKYKKDNIEISGINREFQKGSIDTITFTVTATDPQELPLYYSVSTYHLTGKEWGEDTQDWVKENNVLVVDVRNAIVGSGGWIQIRVDNKDGYSCVDSNIGYDAFQNFYYDGCYQ